MSCQPSVIAIPQSVSFTTVPDDDKLCLALQQYAKEGLTLDQRMSRLRKELNYDIKFVLSTFLVFIYH